MKLFECLILGTLLAAFPVVLSIPDKPAPPEPAIIEYAVITNIHDGDTVSIQFTKEYPIRRVAIMSRHGKAFGPKC